MPILNFLVVMLPRYLAERFERLRLEFDRDIFTATDAQMVLSISKSLTYVILHKLYDLGLIRRVGKGIYMIPYEGSIETSLTLPDSAKKVESSLSSEGIRFVITGMDILLPFIHHLPVRYPHLVHTERGSGEWAKEVLVKAGFRVLVNPKHDEISLGLDLAPSSDLVVIRETSNFYAVKNETATIERALIDLYFEVTREHYPLMITEVGRVFYNTLRSKPINFSRLIRYSRRKKIDPEVKALLNIFSEHIFIPDRFFDGKRNETENTEAIRQTLKGIVR